MDDTVIYDTDIEHFAIGYLYSDGQYVSARVSIRSGAFAGVSSVCLLKTDIQSFYESLVQIDKDLFGTCSIYDCDTDDYLKFEMSEYGRILVSGQLGGSGGQFIKYRFRADQTILLRLIELFEEFLNNEEAFSINPIKRFSQELSAD